jgi:hypothetical protein
VRASEQNGIWGHWSAPSEFALSSSEFATVDGLDDDDDAQQVRDERELLALVELFDETKRSGRILAADRLARQLGRSFAALADGGGGEARARWGERAAAAAEVTRLAGTLRESLRELEEDEGWELVSTS